MVNFIDFLADYFKLFGKILPEISEYPRTICLYCIGIDISSFMEMAFSNRKEWEMMLQKGSNPEPPP